LSVNQNSSESWWEKGKRWLYRGEKETTTQQELINNNGKNTENEEVVDNSDEQTENQPKHSVLDVVEASEINQSLNSSSANLLDKSKQKEEIAMQNLGNEQTAQIQQTNLPYGTPGSSGGNK